MSLRLAYTLTGVSMNSAVHDRKRGVSGRSVELGRRRSMKKKQSNWSAASQLARVRRECAELYRATDGEGERVRVGSGGRWREST